jgi:antitoxin component YwqK of YwqJK toxin-antitoxin module
MFPNSWIYFFLWIIVCWAASGQVLACSVGAHHSTAYHYNKAHQVFTGRVIAQEEVHADTLLLTFRVEQAYRNCQIGEDVRVLVNRYNKTALKSKRHLVYAALLPTMALYCPKLEPLHASNTQRQLRFIKKIIKQPLGVELVEYSPYGRIWARGYYTAGMPYHTWRFYAYSGELQLEGSYDQQGQQTGQWRRQYHTSDANYKVLHAILSGEYARKWDDYAVLGVDTNAQAKFRYVLRYKVQGDTVTEHFYYNESKREQEIHYRAGLREGREAWYDGEGQCYKRYHFERGYLQGDYFERLALAQGQKGYVEVQGFYENDKKQEEIHYYYTVQGDFLYKNILIENGKILSEPRRETHYR